MENVRWVNLWWQAGFAEGFESAGCVFSSGVSDIGVLVFVGNLTLIVVILLGILLLHVAVVSGVETYWLAKVRLLMTTSIVHIQAEFSLAIEGTTR